MIGNAAPETANPAPVTPRELMVSAAVPDEVNVSVFVELVSTARLPNAKLLALAVSCGVADDIPVPESATVVVASLDASVEMVRVPLDWPATVGSKLTWNVVDCPGFSVAGNEAPDTAKPLPPTLTDLIVNGI